MKASRERLRQIAWDWLHPGPWQMAPVQINLADWEPLAEIMEEMIVDNAVPIVVELANLADTSEAIADFKRIWHASEHGLGGSSDQELLRFRDQLRTIWECVEHHSQGKPIDTRVTQPIFQEWFSPKLDDVNAWQVIHNAGRFFPKPENIRALAGRIVIHNSTFLARCSVEKCRRFFIKKRKSQILCLSEDCERARNALANQKLRDKKAQQIRQAVARRVVKRKGRA